MAVGEKKGRGALPALEGDATLHLQLSYSLSVPLPLSAAVGVGVGGAGRDGRRLGQKRADVSVC